MARIRKAASGVGERIESLIPEGISIADFSEEIGISDRTLGNYIRGDREPSYEFLERLRRIKRVDVNWLLTGQGAPYEIERFVDIESDVAQRLDMKEQYVRAIFYRLDAMQDEIGVDLHADAIWYALSMINQVMIRDFAGRDVSDEEMEPILADMVDKQFRQAHGKNRR